MKAELHWRCVQLAQEKLHALQEEFASMTDAVQSESKSSAGDKHETGRAMIHLEQEKLQQQLAEAQSVLAELQQINSEDGFQTATKGALVKTDRAIFYIAVGLGKINHDGTEVFVVSSQSPIAKQMLGKCVGDRFLMNGTEYTILLVE